MITARVSVLMGAFLGLALTAALPAGASAADLGYGSIKDDYAPPPPPRRQWYLKGTIGMHNHEVGDIWTPGYALNTFTVHHKDMKSAPFYGIGFGVEHSRWLRFDVTGEYRGKFLFIAHDSYADPPGPATAGTNEYTADMESWLGLVNAYIDIRTWRGVTPYIGAGVGIGTLSVLGVKDINVPQSSVFYGFDHTSANFAWAIYAGFSYDVSPQLAIDFGYRYLDLGDAESGRVTAYDGSSSYSRLEIRDVTTHDLMVSMRWVLEHPTEYPVAIK